VPAGGFLRVHEVAVDDDFEDPALARDQRDLADLMLELREQFGRQTDGAIEIASDGAVLDADLHRSSSVPAGLHRRPRVYAKRDDRCRDRRSEASAAA
jgi:hypothetical protein